MRRVRKRSPLGTGPERTIGAVTILSVVFWASLGALVWTHAGYPAAAALLARFSGRPIAKAPIEPTVTADADADVRELTQRVVNLHADLLRRNPEPWLWTYKRWKRRPTEDAKGYPFYAKWGRVE